MVCILDRNYNGEQKAANGHNSTKGNTLYTDHLDVFNTFTLLDGACWMVFDNPTFHNMFVDKTHMLRV